MPTEQKYNKAPRPVNIFEEVPAVEPDEKKDAELHSKLDKLNEFLISHCASILEASREERNKSDVGGAHGMSFTERHAFEERKSVNEVDVSWFSVEDETDSSKTVKQYVNGGKDAHCYQGLGVGYTQEALRHWIAYANRKMFMISSRPYTIEPMGYHRQEGDKGKKVLYAVLDHVLKLGNFEQTARMVPDESGTHGVGVLRYEPMLKRNMIRQADGSFEETVSEIVPRFDLWPLEHFYITDWKCPDIHKQRGIFWVEPGIYLSDLEKDEMVVDLEKGIVAGRFINLDMLREEASEQLSIEPAAHGDLAQVSDELPRTKIECDISLPIHYMVKEGLLTPEILEEFRIKVRLDELKTDTNPSGLPDEDNEEEMRMWADKVAQIHIWNVAWVSDVDHSANDSTTVFPTTGTLIRFESSRARTPRNTGYRFPYQPSSKKFICSGIPVSGKHAEREGEILYNANAHIKAQMARPNIAADPAKFENDIDMRKIQRLVNGYGNLIKLSNDGALPDLVSKALFVMPINTIQNYEVGIADSQNRFENQCGIGAAVKSGGDAAPSTGTATELEANLQTSQLRLDDALILCGIEFGQIAHDVVEDLEFILGYEGFVEYCSRVSGEDAGDIAKWFKTIGNIVDEYYFNHPLHALQDQTVLSTLIMRLWQVTAGAAFNGDAQHLARIIFDVSGMPNQTERLMGEMQYGNPEAEHSQMRQGNSVDPEVNEDIAGHLQAHLARLEQLQTLVAQAPDDVKLQTEGALLTDHVLLTTQNQRLVAQTQMAGVGRELDATNQGVSAGRSQITQGGGQSSGKTGGGTKDQNEGESAPSTPRGSGGEAAQVKGQGGNSE